jgi:hypothetical protein
MREMQTASWPLRRNRKVVSPVSSRQAGHHGLRHLLQVEVVGGQDAQLEQQGPRL